MGTYNPSRLVVSGFCTDDGFLFCVNMFRCFGKGDIAWAELFCSPRFDVVNDVLVL